MPIVTNYEKNFKNKKSFNSKHLGIIILIVATIGYLGLFIKWIPFLHDFLLGTFGLFSYVLFLLMYVIGGALVKGAKYVYSPKYVVYLSLALFSIIAVFHIAFANIGTMTYGEYLSQIFQCKIISVGGILMGIIVYPLQKFLYPIGAIFLFLIVLAICIWLIYDYLTRVRYIKKTDTEIFNKKVKKNFKIEKNEPATTVKFELNGNQDTKIGLDAEIDEEKEKRKKALQELGLDKTVKDKHFVDNSNLNSFANDFINSNSSFGNNASSLTNEREPANYRGTFGYNAIAETKPKKVSTNYEKNMEFLESITHVYPNSTTSQTSTLASDNNPTQKQGISSVSDFLDVNFGDSRSAEQSYKNKQEQASSQNTVSNDYSDNYNNVNLDATTFATNEQNNDTLSGFSSTSQENIEPVNNFTNEDIANEIDKVVEKAETTKDQVEDIDLTNFTLPKTLQIHGNNPRGRGLRHSENQQDMFNTQGDNKKEDEKKFHIFPRYVCPTIDLLTQVSTDVSHYNENSQENARAIEKTLDDFGIPAKVSNITIGPAVTRYELDMPAGISVNMVNKYSNDISGAVASSRGVRIQAPIPGKSTVGVEVPNKKVAMVGIREVLESREFLVNKNVLSYAVGKEVTGKSVVADMHDMPHMLVAGATGSGKSVALNTIIISLIYKYGPEDLRFILVDPKQVEFYMYNGLPHLLTPEAIIDPVKSLNALDWAINEMERRYGLMRDSGVREICEYNDLPEVKNHSKEKFAHIVIIIDEVGDIMTLNTIKKDFEEKVRRLTQKARAVGINLILATQRPSVDVITGVIKANLPSRMAFAVQNYQDSKTILDAGGADKLLGKGDMLFSPRGNEPFRVQGCFISTQEINNVVSFVKQHNESYYDESIAKAINKEDDTTQGGDDGEMQNTDTGFDPLMPECLKLVIKNGNASVSMLQRRFSIGNPKAARIIDQMELAKFIGPSNGSKPRTVYITAEQFKEIFGESIDD